MAVILIYTTTCRHKDSGYWIKLKIYLIVSCSGGFAIRQLTGGWIANPAEPEVPLRGTFLSVIIDQAAYPGGVLAWPLTS